MIIFALIAVPLGFSDRGAIPFDPNIQIFEPTQRAMIAWNGEEEILLLSTDLNASESTTVLEVLPLYSKPDVKEGSLETFVKATELINRKINAVPMMRDGKLAQATTGPVGEVVFHEKIGAHDISVTHLLNADGFISWVKEYLRTLGIEREIVSDEMKELIESYIRDDFGWFVFDVVSLSKETKTNEPIQYRFKSNTLFYPLRITGTNHGETSIDLIILTPHLLQRFPGLSIEQIDLLHDPITITQEELETLDQDMYGILSTYAETKLRIWRISGALNSFDQDLISR